MKRERGEQKERRRGRGRRWRSQDQANKVWNLDFCMEIWIFGIETNLDYGFYEIWHVSLGLYDDYFAQT